MSFNVMTPDNDCNSIPPVSMLEAGLRDRIRKRVGLNPNSLCRGQRRYTLSYGASLMGLSLAPVFHELPRGYLFKTKWGCYCWGEG